MGYGWNRTDQASRPCCRSATWAPWPTSSPGRWRFCTGSARARGRSCAARSRNQDRERGSDSQITTSSTSRYRFSADSARTRRASVRVWESGLSSIARVSDGASAVGIADFQVRQTQVVVVGGVFRRDGRARARTTKSRARTVPACNRPTRAYRAARGDSSSPRRRSPASLIASSTRPSSARIQARLFAATPARGFSASARS